MAAIANFVGWTCSLPGVSVTEDQRLGIKLEPDHKSAYDTEMFTKAVQDDALLKDTDVRRPRAVGALATFRSRKRVTTSSDSKPGRG